MYSMRETKRGLQRKLRVDDLIFDKVAHTYVYKGKHLSGVTGVIGRRLNLRFPKEFVGEAMQDGLHVHGSIESWLGEGSFTSLHPGALWVRSYLQRKYDEPCSSCLAEVLVSDKKQYASSVDIIGIEEDGSLHLYDMKRTFNRVYVTWQLSIYKYLLEKVKGIRVSRLTCLATRDKIAYPVFEYVDADVEGLLYG